VARQLSPRGVRFEGIAGAGFITHHENVTTPFEIPATQCLSIIAIASQGVRDLDAHVFSPDGELIAEDTEPDPHPTVQVCAGTEPRRVYHVIETFEQEGTGRDAQGAYAVGAFSSDRMGLAMVARVVGGRPGTAVSMGAGATDAERRLGELRDGIARRAFTPAGEVLRTPFAAQGAVRFPLPVTPDHCYTIAALADGAISDADLSVFDPDGEEIARDIRGERDAFVQLCPAAAGTLTVEVRARPGPGVVLVQALQADAAAVGGANTLWLGERLAWDASAIPLSQAIESARRLFSSQGYNPSGSPTNFAFTPGESKQARLTIEPGRCALVTAVAGRGLGRLTHALYNDAGDLLARGIPHGGTSIAVTCPTARTVVTARMRAEVGSGEAALAQFTGPAPPAWANGVDPLAVSEALATHISLAAGSWRLEGAPDRIRLGARAVRTRDFVLAPGTCTRLAVSAGRGYPVVSLALRAQGGNTLAESSTEGTAIVTRCVRDTERVQLDASIDPAGPAEYDAIVARYVRPDRGSGAR
jgi:hypothetical protein